MIISGKSLSLEAGGETLDIGTGAFRVANTERSRCGGGERSGQRAGFYGRGGAVSLLVCCAIHGAFGAGGVRVTLSVIAVFSLSHTISDVYHLIWERPIRGLIILIPVLRLKRASITSLLYPPTILFKTEAPPHLFRELYAPLPQSAMTLPSRCLFALPKESGGCHTSPPMLMKRYLFLTHAYSSPLCCSSSKSLATYVDHFSSLSNHATLTFDTFSNATRWVV